MRTLLTIIICAIGLTTIAQSTIDFENFDLAQDTFLNGSDLSGGFVFGEISFPNLYNTEFGSWEGWAISNIMNDTTAGFMNQYAAYAGTGADETETYAVANAYQPAIIKIIDEFQLFDIYAKKIRITNATYTALSMRDGDAFAKKFGGETGNDADYLLLTIKGWRKGELLPDSIDFYLADYRFEDNSSDYIIKEWTEVDLNTLMFSDSLSFSLISSDVGMFGMNTPAYFCIDQADISSAIVSVDELKSRRHSIFPNPAQSVINIQGELFFNTEFNIISSNGVIIKQARLRKNQVDITGLPNGYYFLRLQTEIGIDMLAFVKQ